MIDATEHGAAATCTLCGTPVAGTTDSKGAFCCAGCARVHAVLAGLDPAAGARYLSAARALGIIPGGAAPPVADDLPADPSSEREERFRVDGMVCPSCTWIIERVLLSQAGVRAARFDFFSGTGAVRCDLRRTSADALARLLAPLGYRLEPVADEAQGRLSRGVTFAFVACAAITMNLMSLSVIRYAAGAGWIDGAPAFLPWAELALCLPVLWLGLRPIARRAWEGARRRAITMDALIAVSAGAAFALSCAAMAAGRDDIYFETAAGLVTISMLSRMVEARLRERALRDTAAVMRLDIARVRVRGEDGGERYAAVGGVAPGTRVVILAGETIPFDGEVAGGEAVVSEAVLTGEAAPVRKVAGDAVPAGATVVDGTLDLAVTRPYDQTRLFGIAASLRASLAASEGRLRSADSAAAWFAPVVVAVAFGVWAARAALHGWGYALSADGWFPSVAVLAVACPCAFSLAGVAAVTAATWAAFHRGFLVKDGAQFEELRRAETVVFDKTGTLTGGRLSVAGLAWRAEERPALLAEVLAAERHAAHPVAHALRDYLGRRGIAPPAGDLEVEEIPGRGRRARTGNGVLAVGASGIFDDAFVPPEATPAHTLVWFGADGRAEGCFLLTDAVRPDAREAVGALKAMGLRVEILSGDRQEVCDRVCVEVGADAARGDVSLDGKVSLVKGRVARGERIVYVGDGTNDALSMREAQGSIAVAGSTDEALTAAGFVMLHVRLGGIAWLLGAGRRLWRVIRGNYAWAFGFNSLFVPVAAAGCLTPLAAMLLMLVSSSAVLLNSLRLKG